ncbi:MAG TPA: hypothetical protein VMV15_06920 [Candidatus Binataceae bacterium]|nr:hypothetical protein [Candidatus Binataceae bacterium]
MAGNVKSRGIVIGIAIAALIISAAPAALAKRPKHVKGSSAGSFSTTNFSYDGSVPGSVSILSGKDNLNGAFNSQVYSEYIDASTTCTAPDSTSGEQFYLVNAWSITTYKNGAQLIAEATSGGQCVSTTTGFFAGTATFAIAGGTRKFNGASGTVTATFGGVTLFAGLTGPGNGLVGTIQSSLDGMVTP